MKIGARLMMIVILLLVGGYIANSNQQIFSKAVTGYYTWQDDFIEVEDKQMTLFVRQHQQELAQQLIDLRQKIHTQASAIFTTKHLGDLSVLLLDEQDEAYTKYLHGSTIGVYFPTFNTMMLDGTGKSNIQHTFVHEYAHYLVDQQLEQLVIAEGTLPDWFHEGVANYVEFKVLDELPFTFSRFDAVPYDFLWQQTSSNSHSIYHQGFYTIARLTHEFGDGIVMRIIEQTNTQREFNNGFMHATNIDLANFHKQFTYDEQQVNELFELVRKEPHQAERYLQTHLLKTNMLDQYSHDYLFAQVALAVKAHDSQKIDALLGMYEHLLDKPTIYLRLAELIIWFDEPLAMKLLEHGKKVSSITELAAYEAQMKAIIASKYN